GGRRVGARARDERLPVSGRGSGLAGRVLPAVRREGGRDAVRGWGRRRRPQTAGGCAGRRGPDPCGDPRVGGEQRRQRESGLHGAERGRAERGGGGGRGGDGPVVRGEAGGGVAGCGGAATAGGGEVAGRRRDERARGGGRGAGARGVGALARGAGAGGVGADGGGAGGGDGTAA